MIHLFITILLFGMLSLLVIYASVPEPFNTIILVILALLLLVNVVFSFVGVRHG